MITNYKSTRLTLQHQIILNKINLPMEIIEIIKEFAFDDDTTYKAKIFKMKFIEIINTSIYVNKILLRNTKYTPIISSSSIIIKNTNKPIYIQSVYCLKCGEEIWQTYFNIRDMRCLCNENNLSLLDYSSNNKYNKYMNKLYIGILFVLSGIISYFISRLIINIINL